MTDIQSPDRQFRDLLPFYLNGTADVDEQAFVERYLAENPDSRHVLEFERELQHVWQSQETEPVDELLVARIMNAVRRDQRAQSDVGRLAKLRRDWGLTPAFALAASLLVVQSGLMFSGVLGRADIADSGGYRGEQQNLHRADLKITIAPDASFAEVVGLLRANGCRIVAGPSADGEIWVALDPARAIDTVLEALSGSTLVNQVVRLEQSP